MDSAADGIPGPTHSRITVPRQFEKTPGKLRYVAMDLTLVTLVEVDWPKGRSWKDAFAAAR